MKKNDEYKKETIYRYFNEQIADPENLLILEVKYIGEDEEVIAKANLIESLQKQANEENFQKNN